MFSFSLMNMAWLCILLAVMGRLAVLGREQGGFDRIILKTLRDWNIPGAQLAFGDVQGISTRAYGLASLAPETQVSTNSLFRIGSVSKTLTTVAILKLIDGGLLSLDDRPFKILNDFQPPKNASIDPRIYEITIKHLLQHTGGWDQFDALELPWSRMAAATCGENDPPTSRTVIAYMLSIPLDFDPGSKTAYSNFGFCVLGRVIEKISSKTAGRNVTYQEHVERSLLQPVGISSMRIGRTRLTDRADREVRYYPPGDQPLAPSVFPGEGYVPFAYGGIYIEATDSSGGWLASAQDLARFGRALFDEGAPILGRRFVQVMINPADPLCWTVAKRENCVDAWHIGGIKHSNAAWIANCSRMGTIAVSFNSLPSDHLSFLKSLVPDLLNELHNEAKGDPDH